MICVLCPYGIDSGLISKAVDLSGSAPVRVLIPKRDEKTAIALGSAIVHTISEAPTDEGSFALWLKEKLYGWNCHIVLAPATVQMRGIMPILARYMQAGLTADCTALSVDTNQLIQTRPAFGNSLMATIRTLSPMQMATVRPGTFPTVYRPAEYAQVIPEAVNCEERISLSKFLPFTDGTPLSQAQIIIAGGLGVGSKEGFSKLELLAQKLGAAVAASRNAVDAGYASFRCQVGMTGITVCPKLYIAVGISGAVQHLAGMSGAEKIIAVNSDPKAPIFDYADYGIVADWETVIDKLLEELP